MAKKSLENKLFQRKDWSPGIGMIHLLMRLIKGDMPTFNSKKMLARDACYIHANSIYHVLSPIVIYQVYASIPPSVKETVVSLLKYIK